MRSSILANALNISLESADPLENQELNPVTEATVVEVDEVLNEVQEQADNVEEHDEVVEDLEEAAESMESLIASMESAIADGGMNPQAADLYSRSMGIALRRMPAEAFPATVSVESFGGTGDKLVASQEALEGAKATLAKIWNAIKTAVINAFNAVTNFVKTLGTSAAALKRAAALLKQKAGEAKGKDAKGKKVDATAIAKLLHVDGEMKASVGAGLKVVISNGKKISAASDVAAKEIQKLAGAVASGHANTQENVDAYNAIKNAMPQGNMPGGRVVEENDQGFPKIVSKVNLKSDKVEIAVPAVAEIVSIAVEIANVANMIGEFDNKYFKKLEKETKDFISKQDALVKKIDMEGDKAIKGFTYKEGDAKKAVRESLKDFKKITGLARSVGPEYMGYAAKTAKAAFGFGQKALAQYS